MSGAPALRLGTRRSLLARTQSEHVAAALRERTGREVELVEVTTHGDVSRVPLTAMAAAGTGVFVSALRDALLEGRVDLAVHSLKDLPTAPAEGLVVAAVPPREDPRDVLVARDGLRLSELPEGARVGTGSPRRAAQLRAARPDLQVVDVRGNVDTRLRLVSDGEVDAVVLARAGLVRLGRADEATEVLEPATMLPAPGQGALAVECRSDDDAVRRACAVLEDPPTRAAVEAERSLLAALEAGCAAPLGALARVDADGELHLRALVASIDGSATAERSGRGPLAAATETGRRVAADLLASGSPALGPLATTSPAPGTTPETAPDPPLDPAHPPNAHETAAAAPPERVHP